MARRRWYRRSVRVVAAKKRWASNMFNDTVTMTLGVGGVVADGSTLVINSVQNATPTPIILKAGNFKVQGDCFVAANAGTGVTIQPGFSVVVYVLYVPQSVIVTTGLQNVIANHPEWIMAWKCIDVGVGSATTNANSFSMSSRLKRNLNSGDQVMFAAVARGPSGYTPEITITFNAQYWTCSN